MLPSLSLRRVAARGILFSALVGSAIAAVPALASAAAKPAPAPNAVYTMTNDVNNNKVLVFKRGKTGKLKLIQQISTRGKGANNQPPFGFPIVDSSQSVRLSPDGRFLFVVNSGDDSVSSFATTKSGKLRRVSHISSGGSFPVSLAVTSKLLYVVNEKSGDIAGMTIAKNGKLKFLSGSQRKLITSGPNGLAGQIGFAPGGRVLNVTERATNIIDTFKLTRKNRPGPATGTPTSGNTPFGFEYQGQYNLLVSYANVPPHGDFSGAFSSFDLGWALNSPPPITPTLDPVTPPIASNGHASCWVVVTKNQRFAFVSNTLEGGTSHAISRFNVTPDGQVSLINTETSTAGFPTDMGQTNNGRYLYLLLPSNVNNVGKPNQTPAPPTSHIDEYSIGAFGTLTYIGSTPSNLPDSISGIAAW